MEIWVHRNGQYAGRFSESAIRDKVADGSLSATDLAWDEAKSAWKPISELFAAFPVAKTQANAEPSSDAAHPAAATEEAKPVAPRSGPPPLPTMPMRAAGPPPLPTVVPGPGSAIPATTSVPATGALPAAA